jgi:hypothetical protein
MDKEKYYFIFDVESDGLYGKAIAWGAALYDSMGVVVKQALKINVGILKECREPFVKTNVIPVLYRAYEASFQEEKPNCNVQTTYTLRQAFMQFYLECKAEYPQMTVWADAAFPVETNFLAVCVEDIRTQGSSTLTYDEFDMPYPLYEIANVVHESIDRTTRFNHDIKANAGKADEHRIIGYAKHNPLFDVHASAHCLFEAFGYYEPNQVCFQNRL